MIDNSDDKRCAVYLRVSGNRQTTENQRPEALQLVRARGLKIVEIFEETMSAAKQRPLFDRMILGAHQGRFRWIVCWALDRFGRSMASNLTTVLEMDRIGVQIITVREPWLDTSVANPVRPLLVAIFSWVAQQERARLIERTVQGIERARRAGKQLGRPRAWISVERALALRTAGKSIREIANELEVGASTLHRMLRLHASSTAKSSASVVPIPPRFCRELTAQIHLRAVLSRYPSFPAHRPTVPTDLPAMNGWIIGLARIAWLITRTALGLVAAFVRGFVVGFLVVGLLRIAGSSTHSADGGQP
ncbi:MAG: recombinase family protein [Pseudomonadota bacterium]